ncbi:uncharacterized protein [Amphiura filiformis]|uniref:uncharacterized protein n=1 Tax=Amphiura filiformis TaxID=82378 RepID=UPI003B20FAB9
MAYHGRQTSLIELQPYKNHGNSFPGSILAFLLGSCGVAIALAPLVTHNQLKIPFIKGSYYFGYVYMFLAIVICLGYIWKHRSWTADGTITHHQHIRSNSHVQLLSQPSHSEVHHSSSFQIALFGVGSILYIVCNLLQLAFEQEDVLIHQIQLIDRCILLVCCIVYIIFLRKYTGATLKYSPWFHYSIAFIIGGDVCAWIFVTVRPLWKLSLDSSPSFVSNNSTTHKFDLEMILEITGTFLQPFFVEFFTISLSCLLSLWHTMRQDTSPLLCDRNSNQASEIMDEHQDYGAILDAETTYITAHLRQAQDSRRHRFHKRIVVALSIFMGISFCVAGITFILGPFTENDIKKTTRNLLLRCILIVVFLPLVASTLASLRKLQNSTENIAKINQFTTEGYVLLLTATVQFTYLILQLIASIQTNDILYIIYTPLSLMRMCMQTQLILAAHYVHRSAHKLPKLVEFTLIYVIALNLVEWLAVSFMHKWMEDNDTLDVYSPVFVAACGEVNTKIIHLVFDPLKEVYLFHSAVVAFEAQKVKHS